MKNVCARVGDVPSIMYHHEHCSVKKDDFSSTRGHPFMLLKGRIRLRVRSSFFSQLVIGPWWSLPDDVVTPRSMNILERHWSKASSSSFSSYSHFYVRSMYADIRLHVALSYTSSADIPCYLKSSPTLSNRLPLFLLRSLRSP